MAIGPDAAGHTLVTTRAPRQLAQDMPMDRMPAMLNTAIYERAVRFSRGSHPRLSIN